MKGRFLLAAVMAAAAVLYSLSSQAQSASFDVLVDIDRSPATGCSATPSGGATLDGFEHRIRATVDLSSFEVVALERSSCGGAGFGAPVAVPGFSGPYPLALNTGTAGADAVEIAVARAALGAANLSQLHRRLGGDRPGRGLRGARRRRSFLPDGRQRYREPGAGSR